MPITAAVWLSDSTNIAPYDYTGLVPLVTGAGGALAVLLLFIGLFITDRIQTQASSRRISEAEKLRYDELREERDKLIYALEHANSTSAQAAASTKQALELVRELITQQGRR